MKNKIVKDCMNKNKISKKNVIKIIILFIITCIGITIWFKFPLKKEEDIFDIVENLKNMNTYKTNIQIVCKNSKQEILYSGVQKYKQNIGSKLELEKNLYLYKDGKLYIKDKGNNKCFEGDYGRDRVFKLSFIEEYLNYLYTGHGLKESKSTEKLQTLKFILPGNNHNLNKASLVIDKKNKVPKEIKIFNTSGKLTVIVKYNNFSKNIELDNNEFKF